MIANLTRASNFLKTDDLTSLLSYDYSESSSIQTYLSKPKDSIVLPS